MAFDLPEIPAGLTAEQHLQALNNRLRDIATQLSNPPPTLPQQVAPTVIIQSRPAASAPASSSAGVVVSPVLLTGPTTINSPLPSAPGSELVVLLQQDGTGGRLVTWANPPFRITQANLGTKANTFSVLRFTAIADPADGILKWWLSAIPITNGV